jgi:hypothetical protein
MTTIFRIEKQAKKQARHEHHALGFLLGFLVNPEDGSGMFPRTAEHSPIYAMQQPDTIFRKLNPITFSIFLKGNFLFAALQGWQYACLHIRDEHFTSV